MIYPNSSTIINRKPSFPELEKIKAFVADFIANSRVKFETNYNGNVAEYHEALHKEFVDKLGLQILFFQPSNTNNLKSKLYRLREYSESINMNLISEFSYLPAPLCQSFRRANYPYNPVFYCSPDLKTAILETVPEISNSSEGNLYLISEWEFRKNESINITPFFAGNYSNESYLNEVAEALKTNVKNTFSDLSESEAEVFYETIVFLSNLFVKEETYPITSYLAHSHLYSLVSPIRTDVFIYPSVKSDTKTINYAIHPNTVDQKMLLNIIYAIRITNLEYADKHIKLSFMLEKIGTNSNGIIHWQNPDEEVNNRFTDIIQNK